MTRINYGKIKNAILTYSLFQYNISYLYSFGILFFLFPIFIWIYNNKTAISIFVIPDIVLFFYIVLIVFFYIVLLFIKKINVADKNFVVRDNGQYLQIKRQLISNVIIKIVKHSILLWALLNFGLLVSIYNISGESFTYCYELLSVDQYILIIKIIVSFFVWGVLVLLLSTNVVYKIEVYICFMCSVFFLSIVISSYNFIIFFISVEAVTICILFLIGCSVNNSYRSKTLIYFIVNSVASLFLLFGIESFIYIILIFLTLFLEFFLIAFFF